MRINFSISFVLYLTDEQSIIIKHFLNLCIKTPKTVSIKENSLLFLYQRNRCQED